MITMFEAKISDVTLLRDSIASISEFIDEAEMRLTAEGMELISADRAVVAIVDFVLKKEAFDEYISDEGAKMGINTSALLQILRRAKPNDTLSMKLEDNK